MSTTSPDPRKPWYYSTAVGKNVLGSMLKNMCLIAGIEGTKTDHSLRATGATEMFQAGVPEKIIQQRMGHLSLKALRMYERTTDEQQRAVCSVLQSVNPTPSYINELESVTSTSSTSSSTPSLPPACSSVHNTASSSNACAKVYNNCTFNITIGPPSRRNCDEKLLEGISIEEILKD